MKCNIAVLLRRAAALAMIPFFGVAAGHAEDAVLLSSTVPGYVPGTVITDNQTMILPDGTSATLLFRSGTMVRIKGPFQKPLTMGRVESGNVAAFVQDLRNEGVDASVLGASRRIAQAALQGQRIIIDPQRSGIYCVRTSDSIWLRHPAPAGPVKVRSGGREREVSWPEKSSEIEWPSDVQIEDGDRFETIDSKGLPMAMVIFRRIQQHTNERAWIAETMLLGCRDQAEPALRELAAAIGNDN